MADGQIVINVGFDESGKLKSSLEQTGKEATKTSDRLKTLAKVGAAAFAAVGAAAVLAVREFAKFDNQIRGVKTLLDETSFGAKGLEQGFKDLRQGVLDLGTESGQELSVLNKALFDTVSAGVEAAGAIEVVGVSAKLATAGLTDVSVATNGLTSVLNAYQLSADKADTVAGKFFTAQKFGKTTIEELSSSFGLVGAQAQALGISFEEVLASISAVTLGGVGTSEAFTGLRAVIANINKPTADAAQEAKRLGIEFSAAAIRSKGLAGFLEELTNAQGFSADSAAKLFGSVQALGVIQSLTGAQSKAFTQTLNELSDETKVATTFTEAYQTQSESLSFQFDQFKRTVQVLAVEIGEQLAPAVSMALKETTAFLNELRTNQGIKDFLVAAGEIVSFLTVNIASAIKSAIAGFNFLGISLSALAAVISSGFTKSFQEAFDEIGDANNAVIEETQRKEQEITRIEREEQQKRAENRKKANEGEQEDASEQAQKLLEQRIERFELEQEQEQELKEIANEKLGEEREKFLVDLENQKFSEQQVRERAFVEQFKRDQQAKAVALKNQQEFTEQFLKIESIRNSAQIQTQEQTYGQLARLQTSGNSTLKNIGKVFALRQIAIDTAKGATGAYASLSSIPFVGPVLGAAAASALIAFGAEQASQVIAAQDGGIVPGIPGISRGIGGIDTQPALLTPGELITPRENFDEVVNAVASNRARETDAEQDTLEEPPEARVVIGFEGDEASQVLTARQIEDRSLGISQDAG